MLWQSVISTNDVLAPNHSTFIRIFIFLFKYLADISKNLLLTVELCTIFAETYFVLLFYFEIGSHYVALASLRLTEPRLSLPHQCWDVSPPEWSEVISRSQHVAMHLAPSRCPIVFDGRSISTTRGGKAPAPSDPCAGISYRLKEWPSLRSQGQPSYSDML